MDSFLSSGNAVDYANGFLTLTHLWIPALDPNDCHDHFYILLDSVSNILLEILHLNVWLVCNFIFTVSGWFSYQDCPGLECTGEYSLFLSSDRLCMLLELSVPSKFDKNLNIESLEPVAFFDETLKIKCSI